MSFPRYTEYKDSGVEWLGEVPSHWFVGKVKHITSFSTGWTPPTGNADFYDGENPWANISDLGPKWLAEPAKRISDKAVDHSSIRPSLAGSLLFSFKLSIGHVSFAARDMYTNEAIATFPQSERLDLMFAYYALPFYVVQNASENIYGAKLLNQELIKAAPIAVPSIEEQLVISTFLDRETAKIDVLVAEQEKLIALLQEKRQAVISHAVTKGLDPNAPMKDSGVEWLGEVPGHWAVGKCGFYLQILSGFAFPSSGFTDDDSDHRLLRGANVGVSRLKWDDTVYWKRSEDDGLDDYEMVEGDLVIGMDRPLIGEGMRVAKVTAEDLPSLLLQRVASLKVGNKLHADYLHYLLASEMFVAHFSPETTGVSVPHISPDQINKFIIPIPPMSEQLAIVNDVKRLLAEFGGLIAESEIAVGLLQERRTALISAAVTGQIDVRGLASSANAPDLVAASAYPVIA